MKTIWQETVMGINERKVFDALDDSQYDYRTINGIKKSSGLSIKEIKKIITKYKGLIRKSLIKDEKNRTLYTLYERKYTLNEVINVIINSLSKSI